MDSTANRSPDFDIAVNMARQSLYRFAALSLLDPQAGSWTQVTRLRPDPVLHEAGALLRALPEAHAQSLGKGERPLEDLHPESVLELLPDSEEALNAEYERTFGLLVSCACPLYESEYIDSKFAFQRSNTLADVSGFYRAFGLKISDLRPERPDHIVLELEFMSHLLALERHATDDNPARCADYRALCRDAQERFFREHLAWWTPALAKLLGRERPHGYYAAVGVFLAALVPAERALLNLPPLSHDVRPSVAEPHELCDGCFAAKI